MVRMYGTQVLRLLYVALAILCLSQATHATSGFDLVDRQNTGTFAAETTAAETTAAATTSAPAPSSATTNPANPTTSSVPAEVTTTAPKPSTTQVSPETTSAAAAPPSSSSAAGGATTVPPASTSSAPTVNVPPTVTSVVNPPVQSSSSSAAVVPPTVSSSNAAASSSAAGNSDGSSTAASPTIVVSTSFLTVTRTRSDGTLETATSMTETTTTPEVNGGGSDGDSGSMSGKTRDTIIGVVVGIGGAALLGGLAVVFWRIRNRRRVAEEHDSLMESYEGGYAGAGGPEIKSETSVPSGAGGSTRSPFQSTLENYHQPSAPVNASSNF